MYFPTVSVLGCGWLGLPFSEHLISKGYKVNGSTTSEEKLKLLMEKGVNPYLVCLSPTLQAKNIEEFLNTEIIIINIPPSIRKRSEQFHVEQMENLLPHLENSKAKYIMYVSSTSIYPSLNRRMIEEDVTDEAQAESKTLAKVEKMVCSIKGKETTILRCGGLTGYNRLLIKHFAGKKGLKFGNEPVNLIHRDDVVGIMEAIIQLKKWGEIYNICSPLHPLKKDFYNDLCERYDFDFPEFIDIENQAFKLISVEKLQKDISYKFKYPDPMKYSYE